MISVRLPKELENSLDELVKYTHKTKTEIVKEAVTQYIAESKKELSSYNAGKDFFGKYSSGEEDLSSTYKGMLKEKLNEKFNR